MVVIMANGAMSEVGIIGREGLVGLPAFLGADVSPHRIICQVPSVCRRLPIAAFRDELARGGPFLDLVQMYAQALFFMASQSTACNHHHPVEERCARWLLMTHDRVAGETFPMTHEFLSIMLGVRRPSVTLAAGTLQKAGIIRYTRGKVTVLDRAGLEEASCECYAAVRDYTARVLGIASAGFRHPERSSDVK